MERSACDFAVLNLVSLKGNSDRGLAAPDMRKVYDFPECNTYDRWATPSSFRGAASKILHRGVSKRRSLSAHQAAQPPCDGGRQPASKQSTEQQRCPRLSSAS